MSKLDQLIALRLLLRDVRVVDGAIIGQIRIDPSVRDLLEKLSDAAVEIRRNDRIVLSRELSDGLEASIYIVGNPENFYERFEDFIAHFQTQEPEYFFIGELGFRSGSPVVPEVIQHYRQAVRLWKLLVALADHSEANRVFLLSSEKLEVSCEYMKGNLTELARLTDAESDFGTAGSTREEKRVLFKQALQEELRKLPVNMRFSSLLRNFATVYDRYWQNYRLFLEGISFDEIFERYVEKHCKLITELNSVLGGIQTALIGLPIASFLILEKLAVSNHFTFRNTLLALSCFVFVAFLCLLSFSQARTLSASKELARELEEEVQGKHPDLARKLQPSMSRLRRHIRWVNVLLVSVRVLLLGLFCAAAITYSYVSVPAVHKKMDTILDQMSLGHDPVLSSLESVFENAKSTTDRLSAGRNLADYWDQRLVKAEAQRESTLDAKTLALFAAAKQEWRDYRAAEKDLAGGNWADPTAQAIAQSLAAVEVTARRVAELENGAD